MSARGQDYHGVLMSESFPGPGEADFFGRIPLFREFARLLSGPAGPVNWELARQVAVPPRPAPTTSA